MRVRRELIAAVAPIALGIGYGVRALVKLLRIQRALLSPSRGGLETYEVRTRRAARVDSVAAAST